MLASDLLGLGVSPLLAERTATGGTGPLSIAVSSTTTIPTAAANKIGGAQYVVTATGLQSGGVLLPPIGTDAGALLADQFVINNSGTASIQVWANGAGVTISANSTNRATQVLPVHTSITLYPISSTLWIGIAGN